VTFHSAGILRCWSCVPPCCSPAPPCFHPCISFLPARLAGYSFSGFHGSAQRDVMLLYVFLLALSAPSPASPALILLFINIGCQSSPFLGESWIFSAPTALLLLCIFFPLVLPGQVTASPSRPPSFFTLVFVVEGGAALLLTFPSIRATKKSTQAFFH